METIKSRSAPPPGTPPGTLLATLLATLCLLAVPQGAVGEVQDVQVQSLFATHCASCHGERGDGDGTAELDRRARSFRDGGFSYGNTPEALFRTITNGIPGTPMPAFDGTLSPGERHALAAHVRALGPPVVAVEAGAGILAVGERPVFLRGALPPIVDGAPARPRGLLVGVPSGLTFEYRVDDVRLLGVRQGAFAERTDWVGRGGTPVKPLGKLVSLVEGGDPGPRWLAGEEPLSARFRGTRVDGREAVLRYALVDAEGREHASVEERVGFRSIGRASGYVRRLRVTVRSTIGLRLRSPWSGTLRSHAVASPPDLGPAWTHEWQELARPGGGSVLTGVLREREGRVSPLLGSCWELEALGVDAAPPAVVELALSTLLLAEPVDDELFEILLGAPSR